MHTFLGGQEKYVAAITAKLLAYGRWGRKVSRREAVKLKAHGWRERKVGRREAVKLLAFTSKLNTKRPVPVWERPRSVNQSKVE